MVVGHARHQISSHHILLKAPLSKTTPSIPSFAPHMNLLFLFLHCSYALNRTALLHLEVNREEDEDHEFFRNSLDSMHFRALLLLLKLLKRLQKKKTHMGIKQISVRWKISCLKDPNTLNRAPTAFFPPCIIPHYVVLLGCLTDPRPHTLTSQPAGE
ncbi:hypothetical protein MRB53_018519 [Persea americana]|uniref:Uncharacterized protein n=1 Tax=Persea americana TaxID=3435 RepID=A0ACC2M837_PERAE|nr:hypothetical protein MRB53_018519 [Persea americana]